MKRMKIRFSKLSTKIILLLFIIMLSLSFLISLVVFSADMMGLIDIDQQNHMRPWAFLFPVSYGTIIVIVFSIVLNKTLIVRIRKLRDATDLVAKGNFNNIVKVQGEDELSELTESFNKMTSELQANAYLSKDFVRNISHEYKTPLAVIKSYSELIQNEIERKKDIDKAVIFEFSNIIISEVDRLSTLSKTIISLSLLDSTTIIKKEDRFSPAEQIRNILRNTNLIWSEKNIEIILNLDDNEIINNEQLLYQVWENLINNAIKFSNKDGRIKIDLEIKDAELICSIEDNGIGINKEDTDKLFSHFYVGDKSRNTTGSGLGLAIVKIIVEKLNGTIAYKSNKDKGTKFIVKLK